MTDSPSFDTLYNVIRVLTFLIENQSVETKDEGTLADCRAVAEWLGMIAIAKSDD